MQLRVAQVVSVLMVLGGLVLFILRRVFRFHPVSYLDALAENKKAN